MIDLELLVDEMRIEARAAILDGCTLELEPSQFSDCMEFLIDRLRQAEKDAARYRWLRDESNHCGVDGPLAFLTDADGCFCEDEHSCRIVLIEKSLDSAIDEAMQCQP